VVWAMRRWLNWQSECWCDCRAVEGDQVQDTKIERILFELARLKRWKFAAKTKRMNAEQRQMFEEAMAEDQASLQAQLEALQGKTCKADPTSTPPPDKDSKRKARRRALPEHLGASSTTTSPRAPTAHRRIAASRWCASVRTSPRSRTSRSRSSSCTATSVANGPAQVLPDSGSAPGHLPFAGGEAKSGEAKVRRARGANSLELAGADASDWFGRAFLPRPLSIAGACAIARRAGSMRLALRVAELARVHCIDLEVLEYRTAAGAAASGWLLTVKGKGDKIRQVPVQASQV